MYFTWTMMDGIYQCEIDPSTGQLLTADRLVWSGTDGRYPEAPHLYKINGRYYLMIAEGGTEYGHMETIARADSPWGPFEPCPHNPILTHRNLGSYPIQGTGHADLVQAHDGSWWMVFLAFRCMKPFSNYHHLGRETFLAPVEWDQDGWPVVYHDGTIDEVMEANSLPSHEVEPEPARDDFDNAILKHYWNVLRNPHPENHSLIERPGWLRLKGSAVTLDDAGSPAFVARRQQHPVCQISASLDFSPQTEREEAGLTVFMNEGHHYEIGLTRRADTRVVFVRRRIGDVSAEVARETVSAGMIELRIQADTDRYVFSYAPADGAARTLASGAARYLSSEVAGGFTGVYIGMYATGNGERAQSPADFDWFDYQPEAQATHNS